MKKKSALSDMSVGAIIVWGLILFFGLLALGTLFTMLVWNIALVPLVAVCGGSIGKIGFWLAFGVNLVLLNLRGPLHLSNSSSS